MPSRQEKTSCFTYEITMTVQVFAETLEEADQKVDAEGGYVSRRDVVLKDTVKVYDGSKDDISVLAESAEEKTEG